MVLSFLMISLSGQTHDTLDISGITVTGKTIEKQGGYKKTVIDSAVLRSLGYETVGDMLSRHTPVFIRSYGQGNLSTASFRGTSASHTKVLWNGVEIENPMLGQTDFSQIPLALIDGVSLQYGGAGISQSSGSLGGSVILENKPDWSEGSSVTVDQSIGSFESWKSLVGLKLNTGKLLSRSRVFFSESENNYRFKNNFVESENPPTQRRQDAAYAGKAFLQEFYFRKGKNLFSLRMWGQRNFRDIAPPLGVALLEGNESQQNEAFRSLLTWGKQHKRMTFKASSAFVYDDLNYRNRVASIDSKNYSHLYLQRLSADYNWTDNWKAEAGLRYSISQVNSNNYGDVKKRNDLTLFSGLKYLPSQQFSARVFIRQKLVDGVLLPLIPSLGLDVRPWRDEALYFKANISRNYRLPGMNDLYWQLGGNPDLHPEKGVTTEAGVSWDKQVSQEVLFSSAVTVFRNDISNWIAWRPDSVMSYWTPGNIDEVKSQGLEANLGLKMDWYGVKSDIAFNYAYTETTPKTSGKDYEKGNQLVYVPVHSMNTTMRNEIGMWNLTLVQRYTGKRYTSSDNTSFMPAFNTVDLSVGRRFKFDCLHGRMSFKVNNLLNEDYQVIAWYPMPRRHFAVSVMLKFPV